MSGPRPSPLPRQIGLLVTLLGLIFGASIATAQLLVVHLPSSPAESAGRQAVAIDSLVSAFAAEVPGLKPRIFRRLSDLEAFLGSSADEVTLVLSDAALLTTAPEGWDLQPLASIVLDGEVTYRRRVVIPAADAGVSRLAEIRGAPLSVVASAVGDPARYLQSFVFAGLIDPAEHFSSLEYVNDDGEAVTQLLFGRGQAALVSDYHPLVRLHLGEGLRSIYESVPLPLPILSYRGAALTPAQRQGILSSMASIGASGDASGVAAGLGIDGFRALDSATRRLLSSGPTLARKRFERLLPTAAEARTLSLELPPPAAPADLPLSFTVELSPDPEEEQQ